MPIASSPASLRIEANGNVSGVWIPICLDRISHERYVWRGVHPLVKARVDLALECRDACVLLAEPNVKLIDKALLVQTMVENDASTVLFYRFVGPVYFHPQLTEQEIGNVRITREVTIGDTDKMKQPKRKAWDRIRELDSMALRGKLHQRQAFFQSYQRDPNHCRIRIQSRQGRVHDRPGTEDVHLQLAYRQMFLAAMRDFPLLGALAPLWDAKKAKRVVQGSASERWYQLASLAFVLGFRSERITELIEGGSENEIMAREFLSRVRPPEVYEINEQSRNDLVRYIALHINDFATPRISSTEPEFTTNLEGLTKEQRCNRPYETAYRHDKDHLYIENMYMVHITPRAFVTSLAIQRDIFICFLGIMNLENIRADSYPEDPGVDSFPDVTRPSIPAPTSDAVGTLAAEADEATPATPEPVYATELNDLQTFEPGNNLEEASGILRSSEHIILYIWDKHQFVKFTDNAHQKGLFDSITYDLADKGYRFVWINEADQIATQTLNGLWKTALSTRLMLAGPKVDPDDPVGSDVTISSLQGYFNRLLNLNQF